MATSSPKAGQFLLLYGSQTGQAQAIAEEIFERSPKHGLQPELHCMSMFEKKFQLDGEQCVVMVTSTTGDGDPPDTALKFVRRFNRKTLKPGHLAHISYSVLGLGDSNYGNFCNNAKNIDRRFSELGAQRFLPSAFADEVEGLDVTADPWIDALFPALQKLLGVSTDTDTATESTDIRGQDALQSNVTQTEDLPHSHSPSQRHYSTSPSDFVTSTHPPSAPDIVNGTISIDMKGDTAGFMSSVGELNISQKSGANLDSLQNVSQPHCSRTEVLVGQNGDAYNTGVAEELKLLSGVVDNNTRIEVLNPLSGVADKQLASKSISLTTAEVHLQGDRALGMVDMRTSADCDNEAEDMLEINRPMSDAPSLGVSGTVLSEKILTLPAATPAFLTVTYLPPDENLGSKMASLPWQNGCKPPSAASSIMKARLVSAQRLTAESAVKKTLLLTLSVEGSSLKYRPGDSISIICMNDDKEVSQLIKRLGLISQADLPLKLGIQPDTKKRRAAVPPHIPEEDASLRYILKNCIDIREPPKKALLRQLVNHTWDASEKRRLQELCSKEGAEDYTAFVHMQRVSLLDVLYTFPSCHPPLETLLEHLPRLQPRPYSICSCEDWHPGHLDIAFSVVTIPASHSRLYSRRGLCTGWLDDVTQPLQQHAGKEVQKGTSLDAQQFISHMETLSLADVEIRIFTRTNQHFRTPNDLSVPLIMIGPGTGVAPFIGFLQERQLCQQKQEGAGTVGETWLLFGCRHKDKDFLFKAAIEEFQESKVLTRFVPAFSRDPQASPHDPRYVQDNICVHASEICSLIHEKEAVVFVCGDAKHMAADVMAAFETILTQQLGLSAGEAKEEVMKMRIRHRYLEDVWT